MFVGDSDEDAEAEIDGESDAQIARRLAAREMAQQQEEREEEEEERKSRTGARVEHEFESIIVMLFQHEVSSWDWVTSSSTVSWLERQPRLAMVTGPSSPPAL